MKTRFSLDNNSEFPICVRDKDLSYTLWLRNPKELPTLSKRMVLADCYNSINPSNKLLTKFISTINRMSRNGVITYEEYVNYLLSEEINDPLMKTTYGDEDNCTEGNLIDVLRRYEESKSKKYENKLAGRDENINNLEDKIEGLEEQISSIRENNLTTIEVDARNITKRIMKRRKILRLAVFVTITALYWVLDIFVFNIQNGAWKQILQYLGSLLSLVIGIMPYLTPIKTITERLEDQENMIYTREFKKLKDRRLGSSNTTVI